MESLAKLKKSGNDLIVVIPEINEQIMFAPDGQATRFIGDTLGFEPHTFDSEIESRSYNSINIFSPDYSAGELKMLRAYILELVNAIAY